MYQYVFISPHDDDVPFSLGESLLNCCFPNSLVITVFSISKSTIDNSDDNVGRVTKSRKNEHRDFFRLTSDTKIEYLDRLDAPLRLGIADQNVFQSMPSESGIIESDVIIKSIKNSMCEDSILFAPFGLGGHIDHVLVYNAVCSLCKTGFPIVFFEDLPYASRIKYSKLENHIHDTQYLIGRPLKAIDIQIPVDCQKKPDALCLFKTQVNNQILDEIIGYTRRNDNYSAERIWCDSKAFDRLSSLKFNKSSPFHAIQPF